MQVLYSVWAMVLKSLAIVNTVIFESIFLKRIQDTSCVLCISLLGIEKEDTLYLLIYIQLIIYTKLS